ncbi:FKBP-type peptidyl-prolyl cis-trans isomerase [Rufibacter sp. LB8]|uniref:FKBP-type peptidyl-prolyl cis-trans isomerase n=1 Tax=Rufibacter sp. LB8 TaxID=2777781 RepID=UPI00178C256A|nr:FKBP-type peptidyl-prolyl cis-trans isomerase [Rufibacter sp. LB8]
MKGFLQKGWLWACVLLVGLGGLLSSCEEENPYDPWASFDPVAQTAKDDQLIQDYFKSRNLRDTVKTASGLYYKILSPGTTQQKPVAGDSVTVHYSGKFVENDQIVFDSSWKRGYPFKFKVGVGSVIKGWDEGLTYVEKGGRIRLFIPSQLAYGHVPGYGSSIHPDACLIFEVELLDIKKNN